MSIKINVPDVTELKPRITVIGVGGAGGNAINNMINAGVSGVDFVAANTDSQALSMSSAEHRIQMGVNLTEGLGAGSHPEIGAAAAKEAIEEIKAQMSGSHMVFVAAGMGGGTGTGAAPIIAEASKEQDILTVAVVTKPFQFEGQRRMRAAEQGIEELRKNVDTLIVIPNQNLFRIANEKTTFSDAFKLADQVLHAGIACITDLIMKDGLINLDFADVRAVMSGMGSAMMGTGEAGGERRALRAAEEAICNPLLDDVSMRGAKALLISITGASGDLTLYEVDEAASRIREDVAADANIIMGATYDESLDGRIRVSIVASGIGDQNKEKIEFVPERPAAKSKVLLESEDISLEQPPVADKVATGSEHDTTPDSFETRALNRNDDINHRSLERNEEDPTYQEASSAQEPVIDLSIEEEVWHGDGDVKIEKRPPHLLRSPKQMVPQQKSDADQQREPSSFTPSASIHMHRRQRPMPDVQDFPEVGQKELRAKGRSIGEYEDVKPKKKRSIFERLAGVGRSDSRSDSPNTERYDSFFCSPRSSQDETSHRQDYHLRSHVTKTKSQLADEERAQAPSEDSDKKSTKDDEDIEIPSFLHRRLK